MIFIAKIKKISIFFVFYGKGFVGSLKSSPEFYKKIFQQKFSFSSIEHKHYYEGNRESNIRDYTKVDQSILEMLRKLSENPNPESDILLTQKKKSKSKGEKQRTVIANQYKTIMRNFLRKYEEISPLPQELVNFIILITKDELIQFQRKNLRTIVSF